MKTSNQIRADFLDYFRRNGHEVVASSPLVPGNDPTLLFTNAGMVQFKDVFLGAEKRANGRAASAQRCVRAGGKHNDLDQVGYTARHHTFFEMLGNFSFGDYFKRDAIRFAWQLLTEVWKIPAERLLVTVYHSDDEAFDLWNREIGLPAERIVRIGDNKGAPYASDNFWQMADTGPCGPCTEIFYDHGEGIPGGPPGSPDEDGDRFIEIWNLVFMQFDRQADGSLLPLPAPCVDTGMGLERLAAVLQGVHSNYEIDLFRNLIAAAAAIVGSNDLDNKSLRVIADHIRACAFLIVDGVLPSNEGRGYVLRRIIRRAVRHIWKLGALAADGAFWRMLRPLVAEMGEAYPELAAAADRVEQVLRAEEAAFAQTLDAGMQRLDGYLERSGGTLDGDALFQLHDTYGCPPDLILDILRERGRTPAADAMAIYQVRMDEQRERARSASRFGGAPTLPGEWVARLQPTAFEGYERLVVEDCQIVAIIRDGQPTDALAAGEQGLIVLDRTPFYAESGGQVGDAGELIGASARFQVVDTQKVSAVFHGHVGRLAEGRLTLGDRLVAQVDADRRSATVLNHSATHLLHAALRRVLGEHVQQKGSLVAADRLRFDFSHFAPIAREALDRIEAMVNAQIRYNADAEARQMDMASALDMGAIALFGEKYGERVRVLRMGEFSTELCGGTHVRRTGDIGLFRIVAEGGISAGIRRIEAVTGQGALDHIAAETEQLDRVAALLGSGRSDVAARLAQMLERQKKLERELESLKARAAAGASADLAAHARDVAGLKVVAARIEGMAAKDLRAAVDTLKSRLGDAVIVLAAAADGKVSLVSGVSGAALAKVKAGDLLAHVAGRIGGKGGGRADLAQGGGPDHPALPEALDEVADWVGRHAV
ncbi:MAG TPA: alanine--tRNA ligase [Xanthomonadales bacterium]|nr:alanine--tRNA ligase [Xanthomonadales bacterium]